MISVTTPHFTPLISLTIAKTKMITPTYIYLRVYENFTYTGITIDLKKRQLQHNQGLSRTTNRLNKNSKLLEIRYKYLLNKKYEYTFKKYTRRKKLKVSKNWNRWEL